MQFKNVLQRIFTAIEKNAIVHFIIVRRVFFVNWIPRPQAGVSCDKICYLQQAASLLFTICNTWQQHDVLWLILLQKIIQRNVHSL